jgi:hypothetical protein
MPKVSDLPNAAALTGSEILPLVQQGEAKQVRASDLGAGANARIDQVEAETLAGVSALALASHFNREVLTLRAQLAALKRGALPAVALAARIRNSGWVMEIDVAEADAGGTFDPSKLSLTLFDKGFDEFGRPIVRPRVLEVTEALRLPSPNQAEGYETIAAGVATWRLSLSKQAFAKAKRNANGQTGNSGFDPWLTLAAGWYNVGGQDAPDQDGVTTINNSTEAYPKMALRNLLPPYRLLGQTAKFEVTGETVHAAEGRTFAAMRCDLVGQTSGVVRSKTVAEMIEADAMPKLTNAIPAFQAAFGPEDMTAFTQGEEVRERWRGYPWIGDAPIDSDDGDASLGEFATHTHFADHAGTFPRVYAVVNATAGNDGTGAASTESEGAAAATPFATDKAALLAAWQLNVSAHGRNNQSGIEICFSDETHTLSLLKSVFGDPPANFGAEDVPVAGSWCVYRPVTGATNCILQRAAAARTVPRRTVLRGFAGLDLVGVTSGTPIFIDGGEANDGSYGQEIWIDNSPFIDAQGAASTACGLYRCGKVWMTGCDQPEVGVSGFAFGNVRQNYMLVRDTDCAGRHPPFGFCYAGVHVGWAFNFGEERGPTLSNILPIDNIMLAGVSLVHTSTTGPGMRVGHQMPITAYGVLNLRIESYGTSQGAVQISADGANINSSNFFADYVTVAGNRVNIGYEDTFTMVDNGDPEQQLKKLLIFRRSILGALNTKVDTFQNNGARIHTWNVAYRVGWEFIRLTQADSTISLPSNPGKSEPGAGHWIGEAWPSTMIFVGPDARAQFENYQANHQNPAVVGVGGGDYTPAAGSVFLGVIPADDEACPIDLVGNQRSGAVGALERAA